MKLLIDMDGVLVDFMQGIIDRLGLPFDPYPCPGSEDFYPFLGMSKARFWNGLDEEFWANLGWTPDGQKILHIAEHRFGRKNICILFQRWTQCGLLDKIWAVLIADCAELGGVDFEWQAADTAMGKARFGGTVSGQTPQTEPKTA